MISDPSPEGPPSSVLLVEDNPIIAMNTEALLLDIGVGDVRTAASVEEAFRLIDAQSFDFALLDFKLGDGEDSLPIAERLVGSGVGIAFATGLGDEWDVPESLRSARLLKKPYTFEELERVVRGG